MQPRTPNTASLIRPLRLEDVLIEEEIVQYNERRHWAILIQPFLETVGVLVFITLFAGGIPSNAFGGFIILFALVMAIVRFRRTQRKKSMLYLSVAGLLVGFLVFGASGLAVWAILITAGRFIYQSGMWAFYVRLYMTNRRIILASGLLGARIDSMPLTRLTDVNFERSVAGEILGYGRLRVETAGQDQALGILPFVDQVNIFYDKLIRLSTAAVGSVTETDVEEEIDSDDGAGTREP